MPVQIIDGRIMVPLSVISRALGREASWDAKTNTVQIYRRLISVGHPVLYLQNAPTIIPAIVTEVVDGDTIRVLTQNEPRITETVQLAGINAPESSTLRWLRVGAYVDALIKNERVWLEVSSANRDRRGRLLAYVWLRPPNLSAINPEKVRRSMLNARLLISGYARPPAIPPSKQYKVMFSEFIHEAAIRKRGMWRP